MSTELSKQSSVGLKCCCQSSIDRKLIFFIPTCYLLIIQYRVVPGQGGNGHGVVGVWSVAWVTFFPVSAFLIHPWTSFNFWSFLFSFSCRYFGTCKIKLDLWQKGHQEVGFLVLRIALTYSYCCYVCSSSHRNNTLTNPYVCLYHIPLHSNPGRLSKIRLYW